MFAVNILHNLTIFFIFCVIIVNSNYSKSKSDQESCLKAVKTVLDHNSPGKKSKFLKKIRIIDFFSSDIMVIPNGDEQNKFSSNNIHISVT